MQIELPEKRYYSIGEVAKAFDVNPSLLRFWEKEFQEIEPQKKPNGTRKYTPENVAAIQFIHHLVKEKGMTISGAKNQLKNKGIQDKKLFMFKKLEQIKADLQSLKTHL